MSGIDTSLHNSLKHSHIHVVGVKWTSFSNLVVHTQASSPLTLVAALKVIQDILSSNLLIVKDIIPNTRWSCVTLSHVYTGKGPNSPHYNPDTIHEELAANNLSYAHLTIQQLLNWIHNPSTFKDGQISTISFTSEDPDGNTAQ